MTKNTAIETIKGTIMSPARVAQMQALVPEVARRYLTPDRIVRTVLAAASRSPTLLQCTPASILVATMDAVSMGLEPHGPLAHTYFVPYRNKKLGGAYEAQCIVGYRGMLELCRRSGELASVRACEVYQEDDFQVDLGEQSIRHRPSLTGRGDHATIIGAYCVAQFKNGERHIEWCTRDQVDAHRARSRASESGPWVTDYGMMARKTVIRVAHRYWPQVIELAEAIEREDDRDRGVVDGSLYGDIAEAATEQVQVSSSRAQRVLERAAKPEAEPQAEQKKQDPPLDAEQQALLDEYEAEAKKGATR